MARRLEGKIFYLAWQQVLRFLDAKRAMLDREQQVYLEELLACIREEAAKNSLNELLRLMRVQAVAASGESAQDWSQPL